MPDFSKPMPKVQYSVLPTLGFFQQQMKLRLRLPLTKIEQVAEKKWDVAPGNYLKTRQAIYLPGQLERVTGRAYSYHWADNAPAETLEEQMAGGISRFQEPTKAYLIKDAYLIDGAIYKADYLHRLFPRKRLLPSLSVENEVEQAALYGSYDGNIFFGLWLTDDCSLYPLAKEFGIPITTNQDAMRDIPFYEKMLGMEPTRLGATFFREIIIFDDRLQNKSKRERFDQLRRKILHNLDAKSHPGIFIKRGNIGTGRNLLNETELADFLRTTRGFIVVDVNVDDASTILRASAGARIVAGLEGSNLMHALMVLEPGASVFVVQPPNRFCPVIKRTVDRDEQNYAFVVGHAKPGGFVADLNEVEKTLELVSKTS